MHPSLFRLQGDYWGGGLTDRRLAEGTMRLNGIVCEGRQGDAGWADNGHRLPPSSLVEVTDKNLQNRSTPGRRDRLYRQNPKL